MFEKVGVGFSLALYFLFILAPRLFFPLRKKHSIKETKAFDKTNTKPFWQFELEYETNKKSFEISPSQKRFKYYVLPFNKTCG